jgi:formylmethanofuran dehydrogenase subunit E
MSHKCAGEWYTWTQEDIESAKQVDPRLYKGVIKVQSKICDTCGNLMGERREYK